MCSAKSRWIVVFGIAAAAAAAGDVTFRTVAMGLESAPGTGGAVFQNGQNFSYPTINASGQVAFRAGLTGAGVTSSNNLGIWSEGGGALALLARSGDVAPGVGAGLFRGFTTSFNPVDINDDGEVLFPGLLVGDGVSAVNDAGLWAGLPGAVSLVIREDDPCPGVAGAVFGDFGTPSFNTAGHVAFLAFLRGPAVNSFNDFAVCSTSTGVLGIAAREGNPAEGFPGNHEFLFIPPTLSGQGTLAFNGTVTGAGLPRGVWKGVPGSIILVARRGDPAPGAGDATFNNFSEALFRPLVNDAGHVAFVAELTNAGTGTSGIWAEDGGGSLRMVARAGAGAPGTGSAFGSFNNGLLQLRFNGAGKVAFTATLVGSTPATDTGIWAEGATLQLVAREGQAAPGTGDAVFGDMANSAGANRIVLNRAGQIAFKGFLTGPDVSQSNDEGIWMSRPGGDLGLVLREGDVIEVAPGQARTIDIVEELTPFPASGPGGEDGIPSPLNDAGELAVLVRFIENNEQAILVASFCCPQGDVDCSGATDLGDLATLLGNFGMPAGANRTSGDLTGDGAVDLADLAMLLGGFGSTCP